MRRAVRAITDITAISAAPDKPGTSGSSTPGAEGPLSALFPLRCAVCGSSPVAGRPPVAAGGGVVPSGLCSRCAAERADPPHLDTPPGLVACLAAYSYEGVVAGEILAMKAAGRHAVVRAMARDMLDVVQPHLSSDTVIAWAPTSGARRRLRGFDQAEELAKAIGREASLTVFPLLRRTSLSAQHGADRNRRSAVAFAARQLFSPGCWPPVVVVDDVRTTGATFGAAARAIRDVGGEKIIGIAYAATPFRR